LALKSAPLAVTPAQLESLAGASALRARQAVVPVPQAVVQVPPGVEQALPALALAQRRGAPEPKHDCRLSGSCRRWHLPGYPESGARRA